MNFIYHGHKKSRFQKKLIFGISRKISGNIMSHQITIDYSKDRKKSKKKLNYA
ncbi:hypothetical protein LEP1GSC060_1944 [Leptospira weilii serovar Ranarum str. ICFT]|uniref:Uncharacterized protein n=1 Tax=Leptospira weilii serovar Ranarum str. ICFT TaxID=1218598 RepID=N1WGP5_9LEPT|nr:hypothetical protein LEP1GSC060_1944 [Leptospira weilii serovar Ranarum str. ICFT]